MKRKSSSLVWSLLVFATPWVFTTAQSNESAYRYNENNIGLESKRNLGISYEKAAPKNPKSFPRPTPLPQFHSQGRFSKSGNVAQIIHAFTHAGTVSESHLAGWSQQYGKGQMASNGHTWVEGMTEAWFLSGEATVIESALKLGKHITWMLAPGFKMNVMSPRSAGWSLRAILALYRATADPEYLKASEAIVSSVMQKQEEHGSLLRTYQAKPNLGMIPDEEWEGQRAISNFQQGLMSAGLGQYALVKREKNATEAFFRAADFSYRSWPGSGGWPYDIRGDGTPSPVRPKIIPNMNILNAESVAVAGMLKKDPNLLKAAEDAFLNTFLYYDADARAQKKISFMIRSAGALMGALHQGYKETGMQWTHFDPKNTPDLYFKEIPDALTFDMYSPENYRLEMRLLSGEKPTSLKLTRVSRGEFKEHLKKPRQRKIQAVFSLFDYEGNLVLRQSADLSRNVQALFLEQTLEPRKRYTLRIEDPSGSSWNLEPSGLSGILFNTEPSIYFYGVGVNRYTISVPEDSEELEVQLESPFSVGYGAALLDPDGMLLGFYRDMPEEKQEPFKFTIDPSLRNKPLSLIIWANMRGITLKMRGASPWMARTGQEFFYWESE